MRLEISLVSGSRLGVFLGTVILFFCGNILAQERKMDIEFTGMFWMNTSYNFQSSDPNWLEMLRPSKILTEQGQPFSENGEFAIGIRPSRFGFNSRHQTDKGEIRTRFELDLVGGGSNIGQTFFRVFNAYVEWNRWSLGQKNSVFMDGSIGPSTVDFFGPSGMVLLRNIQISYRAVDREDLVVTVGLENPTATSDLGQYGQYFDFQDRLENIDFTNKLPALTFHYRRNFSKGHAQVSGVAKYITWYDRAQIPTENYSGSTWGYGINLTGSLQPWSGVRWVGAFVTGSGVQNFLNDGTANIGAKANPGNLITPVVGEAIPFYSMLVASEFKLNEKLTSTIAFSRIVNQTFDTQLNTAFENGNYFTFGFIHKPISSVSLGLEYQYASRQNTDFSGAPELGLSAAPGNSFAINKLQAMFVYRFSSKL